MLINICTALVLEEFAEAALVSIFNYGMESGIKMAEKYCRSAKRKGHVWKFDSILDKVEVPCEDKYAVMLSKNV